MVSLKSLGLSQQLLRCRDNYHHVYSLVGVVVLVCYVVNVFWLAYSHRGGLVVLQRNVVKTHIAACGLGYADSVFGLQVLYCILVLLQVGLGVTV